MDKFITQFFQIFAQAWAYLVQLFGGEVWSLMVVVILIATLMIDLIVKLVLRKIHYKLLHKQKMVLDAFVDASIAPVRFYIWLSGLVLVLTTLLLHFAIWAEGIHYIKSVKSSIGILALGWYVIRVMNRLESELKAYARRHDEVEEVSVEAGVKIIKLTAFVITGLIVLTAFNVNLTGILAFGGMGGIAVGFAAKDLLGNIFGGLMLYMDKPFKVGEWVRSPDRELEGTVEKIGWRMTVIRTFDKRPLYVPNGIFSTIAIENPTRMTNRRIKEVIGIRYCDADKIKQVSDGIRSMLQNHPDIDQNQTLIVNFLEFSDSSLNFLIYTFTRTRVWTEYHEVKEDVLIKIAEVIDGFGAEMAFPTRTLYVENFAQEDFTKIHP